MSRVEMRATRRAIQKQNPILKFLKVVNGGGCFAKLELILNRNVECFDSLCSPWFVGKLSPPTRKFADKDVLRIIATNPEE